MRQAPHCVLLSVILLIGSTAHAADFSGRFYELGSNRTKLLFTNKATMSIEGDTRKQHTVFRGLDGAELVIEDALWERGVLKQFSVDKRQLSEKGLVEVKGDTVHFSYTKNGKTETATEKRAANFITTAEVDEVVHAHWAEISKGDSVHVRLAVPDRLETVGFKFFKDRDLRIDGADYVVVTMAPSAFFIGLVVKPLSIVFFKDGAGIKQMSGRTSPKAKRGDSWVDVDADADFVSP